MALCCDNSAKFYRCIWSFSFLATATTCILLLLYYARENKCSERRHCSWLSSFSVAKLRQENCRPICTTKECLMAASYLLEKIDDSVDPCENFYAYACGSWTKRYSESSNHSILNNLYFRLKNEMKDILENINSPPETIAGKMRTVYESCININASQLASMASVQKFLGQIGIPDWPHLSSDFTFTRMEETLAMMAAYNTFAFLKFGISPKQGNHSDDDYIPVVLPYEILNVTVRKQRPFIKEGQANETQDIVTQILTYFGMDEDSAEEGWRDFVEFDQGFLNMSDVADELNKKYGKNKTLNNEATYFLNCSKEVHDEIVSLCKMLEHFITYLRIEDRCTTNSIIVTDAYHINRIFSHIANHTQRTVANYLALRLVLANLNHMSMPFAHLRMKHSRIFSESSHGFEQSSFAVSRLSYCAYWISVHMSGPLALEYIPKNLPKEAREEISDIFEIIKERMINATAATDWISEDKRKKLTEMVKNISISTEKYVDIIMNKTEIEEAYKEYRPTKESFLLNVLEHQKERYRRIFSNYSSHHSKLSNRPFMANAHYWIKQSHIELLFGILFPPVYLYGRSKSANLAALGLVIGHEIGHAYEHFFDKGNMDDHTRENYLAQKNCLTDQYGDFEIQNIGQKINTSMTFRDDLADHLGFVIAIQAHRRHVEEYMIPGLNFSPEQTFFLSFAQLWCTVSSKEEAIYLREHDEHSPGEFRVIGVLQNSEEFAEAFECPIGSPMNPKKKCSFLSQPSS